MWFLLVFLLPFRDTRLLHYQGAWHMEFNILVVITMLCVHWVKCAVCEYVVVPPEAGQGLHGH
jgi:hypothetical protein